MRMPWNGMGMGPLNARDFIDQIERMNMRSQRPRGLQDAVAVNRLAAIRAAGLGAAAARIAGLGAAAARIAGLGATSARAAGG